MDGAQVSDLDDFYINTTKAGSLRFNWVNSRTGASAELRFVERPKYDNIGGDVWRVQLQLEVMP